MALLPSEKIDSKSIGETIWDSGTITSSSWTDNPNSSRLQIPNSTNSSQMAPIRTALNKYRNMIGKLYGLLEWTTSTSEIKRTIPIPLYYASDDQTLYAFMGLPGTATFVFLPDNIDSGINGGATMWLLLYYGNTSERDAYKASTYRFRIIAAD